MKFAYIIMGKFEHNKDKSSIGNRDFAEIIGVSNLADAIEVAKELVKNGIDCIELCGAFGENGARKIIEAINNKVPVGFVTHLPEQDELYK